ncbi:MAG TPA: 1,4-dihydroxy-2-naphthoate polyprenyltransferase [Pseudonocardiaceae bacterium]|nr:1,4-dihydroxy-2-naphthoate polyprenyltransferase [Pseudonocardiaceae bacterium]
MASLGQWVEGARPRTLPNALAPVFAGWGAAAALGPLDWTRALLALAVALGMVIGVNYANDYSDGIRGTDADRVGPMRLVGSGAATPAAVRTAALVSLGAGALAGVVLVALAGQWWLLVLGAASITAAWFYTGGRRPYGYAGLGELAVFLFFGPVAVLGTQYVLSARISPAGVATAAGVGALSAAVLVANNLRDIPTDAATGKHTLAVRLGERRTRDAYTALLAVPLVISLGLAVTDPAALIALIALVLAVRPLWRVRSGAAGPALIPVLRDTALTMLGWAALTGAALAL